MDFNVVSEIFGYPFQIKLLDNINCGNTSVFDSHMPGRFHRAVPGAALIDTGRDQIRVEIEFPP
jgi:hypothetical protein